MKNFIQIALFIFIFSAGYGQGIPLHYYDSAIGKNGTELKEALHKIIFKHTELSYAELWSAFTKTDAWSPEIVWDIYSDIPGDKAPYTYKFDTDKCGTYSGEGDCYNREHTWPQSLYGGNYPMYSDLFLVYPTDGWVNNKRGNLPYGEVRDPADWTSLNGSKVGINQAENAPAGICFEPIDSFKGDIARTYFYIVARYYTDDGIWNNWAMANKSDLKPWAVKMLLNWHQLDPVSSKEIDRNNQIYGIQNNRNPFIDHPEMAECMFGYKDCSLAIDKDKKANQTVKIYPNPAKASLTLSFENADDIQDITFLNIKGIEMKKINHPKENTITVDIDTWPSGVYIIKIIGGKGFQYHKFIK